MAITVVSTGNAQSTTGGTVTIDTSTGGPADLIIALLEKPDTDMRLTCQTLKWRDGAARDFDLRVEYDHCFMGSKESGNNMGGFEGGLGHL